MRKPAVQACQQNLFDIAPAPPKPKEKKERDYVFDIVDALTAPILTFSQLWADVIPKRMLDIIPMARLIALKQGEELASYPEVVTYIYTRTHEAPMDCEWVDIYTHVSCQTVQTWFNEDAWEQVRAPRILSEWLQSKLDDLRRHIYRKRRELLKSRLKTEATTESQKSTAGKPEKRPSPGNQPEQKSMF